MSDLIQRLKAMGTTLAKQAAARLEITEAENIRLTARVIDLDKALTDAKTSAEIEKGIWETQRASYLHDINEYARERDEARAELEALRADMKAGLAEMEQTINAIEAA